MANEGQLPTPLTPSGSGPTPGPPDASSSTHAAFPSIADLRGPGEPGPTSGQGEGSSKMKFLQPTTPEQLFSIIESPAARDVSVVVDTLEQLAGGPIAYPLSAAAAMGRTPAPAPLLALPGLELQTLPDEKLRAATLGLVYVLSTRLNARPDARSARVLEDAARFCTAAEPLQLAVMPARVTEFAWSFLRAAQAAGRVDLTLAPLEALLHATAQPSYFNPVHAVFLEACLYAGAYQAGARSLTQIYVNAGDGINYIDVLVYHHHAGTILAMLEQYGRATEMFSFAAAMPTSSLSAIQIQCAKRAILCELISSGKQVQFPKDTSSVVTRWMDKNMQEYLSFAKAFAKGEWGTAEESLNTNAAVFADDNNLGLARRVLRTITMRRILNLRRTYSRLTVADLTERVGLSGPSGEAEVLATVQRMSAAKTVRAVLTDGPSPVLTFLDDDDYAAPDKMRELKQAQQLASWLHADLERGNRAIGLNKKWLTKQLKYDEREAFPEKYSATRKKTLPDDDGGSGSVPAVRGVGSNLADMGF